MQCSNKDRKDFQWLNKDSELFLKRGYLIEGVTPLERIRQIADNAEDNLQIKGFSDKFYGYMARGYYSLSSPIWANYGLKRGLPISCFGSYINDSMEGIMGTLSEIGMMSKLGGGTSAYFGDLRPRGSDILNNGKSNGSFNFTKLFDTIIDVVSQGTSRKGQFAGYIDIEHKDIDEWLEIHTEGNPIQLMHYGVCIGKKWWHDFKNEKAKGVSDQKRKLWKKIMEARINTGIPYIFFKDNVNNNTVDVYRDKDMKIHASNLCTEIMLPSSDKESFVCCLSSMNLLHYDEWKDTDAVETLTYFLDSVLSEFIDKSSSFKFMDKARIFAKNHRAIGLGALGWHSYLQSNMIAFESFQAMQKNAEIFKFLKERTYKASKSLAEKYGEPELLKGYGRRNSTLMSVAPTKSSSFILGGVSLSVEPFKANYYIKDLAKAKVICKNPFLLALLESKKKNKPDIWESILLKEGSVQHLSFLSENEKNVFKTFQEISQLSIIQQAGQRQKFIDQGQSINITIIPPNTDDSKEVINEFTYQLTQLYIQAEELGLKSLYYQNNINSAQQFNRDLLACGSCEA